MSDFTTTRRLLPGCSLAFPVVGQVGLLFDVMYGNTRRLNRQRFGLKRSEKEAIGYSLT